MKQGKRAFSFFSIEIYVSLKRVRGFLLIKFLRNQDYISKSKKIFVLPLVVNLSSATKQLLKEVTYVL